MSGSRWSQEAYLKAFRFAAGAHRGQLVPGTEYPYVVHTGMVAMEVMAALVIEEGLDGNLAVQCALLHDVIEDTGTTFEQVGTAFGLEVADGVLALSKKKSLPAPQRLADSLGRIQERPREVWMVKLADRITNLQPPPAHWTQSKIASYRREAAEILERLGAASGLLAERLAAQIGRYGEFTSEHTTEREE